MASLETELLQFPQGVNDDQVDALSLIGRMLDAMGKGAAPEPAKPAIQVMEALNMDKLWELEKQYQDRY